ncbi:MAG: N-6 DNA methylase [Parcubacteria group bacterium]|nr:N-6 DNA methylase [Parcubacteria group bacterium]
MQKLFANYIQSVSTKFSHKETSEMGYRTDFESLLKGIFESINVKRIDHDARAKQGNKPDFVLYNHEIPILYIEAKDIGVSLDKVEKSEQMARYYGYTNLVLTDYVEFRFYRNGEPYEEPIKIANYDLKNRTITPISENYEHATKTLLDFTQSQKEPITSGQHLAKIMGGRAQRIRDNVKQLLAAESGKDAEINRVYEAVKKFLVHDLTLDTFADMYAQTLVYGLFVARFHDETQKDFSRQEARDLVPASNPFLGHFFDHIAGRNFEKRLGYIVDELCEIFSHANVKELMKQYFKDDLWGQKHEGPDPVIHFYEDFLKEYDADLRKNRGAYYTPLPVVRFIVRAIDTLLQKEFKLLQGLADTTKEGTIHKVQILDPAVGTGTFLSEIVDTIYQKFSNQKGRWTTYVHHDLLPRLHGFELMMAPYTIAHLKLSMKLADTGFTIFNKDKRLGIYLTNSLEESSIQPQLLALDFGASIAEEAKEASKIKNEKPIMVVLGNPPYSVSSPNKGEWIQNLIEVYKKDLNERNIQPISDDYIKFLRFAEHFIEKNKTGIVAMITNNSFIDGTIHRQMRKHLLETFDEIYILDLHGNSKKKEKAPDGGKDENVFDIQQGVSINIFVRKNKNKTEFGTVYHSEIFGKREKKFKTLNESDIEKVKWHKLNYSEPQFFFVPKDFSESTEYQKGFKIDELFKIHNAGTATGKDSVFVQMTTEDMTKTLRSLDKIYLEEKIVDYLYRPFDIRKMPYDSASIQRLRTNVMGHMRKDNVAFLTTLKNRQVSTGYFFISKLVTDRHTLDSAADSMHVFPLYAYSEGGSKTANLEKEIVSALEKTVGSRTPEDIFDYIYAVLHSPNYREKYKEFLKIDFPRVPYPKDKKQFERLVALGRELHEIHVLESPKVSQFITTYPISGSNTVEKVTYKDGKAFINTEQYFGDVPEIAWNFFIGGYQPVQKWLKDRKGRTLTNEDIEHYQKIIVALVETDKIMKKIDKINIL